MRARKDILGVARYATQRPGSDDLQNRAKGAKETCSGNSVHSFCRWWVSLGSATLLYCCTTVSSLFTVAIFTLSNIAAKIAGFAFYTENLDHIDASQAIVHGSPAAARKRRSCGRRLSALSTSATSTLLFRKFFAIFDRRASGDISSLAETVTWLSSQPYGSLQQ